MEASAVEDMAEEVAELVKYLVLGEDDVGL